MERSLFQDSEETIHSAEKKLPHMKAFSLCIDNKQQTTMPITKNQRQKLNKMSFSSSNMARFHWWYGSIGKNYYRRGSRYGCETVRHMLKNGLKHKKMHFLPVFELISDTDSLTNIKVEPHQCPSQQSILLTQGSNHENFMKKYWELVELENEVFLRRPFWILISCLQQKRHVKKELHNKGLVSLILSILPYNLSKV